MILNIGELNENYKNIVGNKAYNLHLLAKNGYLIASGFVISTNYFDNYKNTKQLNNLQEIEKSIIDIIGKNKKIIIRSSANLEDGENISFAGIFESFLDVKLENLEENIIKIYKSIYSDKANSYYVKNNLDQEKIKMSIIIQELIEPKISGICFTRNPVNGKEEMILEYTSGSNQEIVSGLKSAKKAIFDNKLKLINEINEDEELGLIRSNLNKFKEIEKIFNSPQDIEWGISENGDIIIYQSRPITFQTKLDENEQKVDLKVIAHGSGLSGGIISGKFKFLNTDLRPEELVKTISKEDIIFADRLRVDQIIAIKNVAGVIVTETGILSHTAIQAREFGIPCIGGIYEKSFFVEGQIITIDGSKGLIYEGDIEKSSLENFDIALNSQNFPNYYNIEQIKNYQLDDFEFLYCIKDNSAMIYLPKVEDQKMITKSTEVISKEFGIKKNNIFINKIKIYDSPNASSSVYSFYLDYTRTISNPEFLAILDEAKIYMNDLENESFKKLGSKIRNQTHETFIKGYNIFQEFKNTKEIKKLEEAAKLLDKAIKLTIMFSNVIVFSFGTYYLEKHLQKDSGTSLVDFFNNKSYQNIKINEFSEILINFKNTEMDSLSYENTTFIDIIDYIYENGFEEHVQQYKW